MRGLVLFHLLRTAQVLGEKMHQIGTGIFTYEN